VPCTTSVLSAAYVFTVTKGSGKERPVTWKFLQGVTKRRAERSFAPWCPVLGAGDGPLSIPQCRGVRSRKLLVFRRWRRWFNCDRRRCSRRSGCFERLDGFLAVELWIRAHSSPQLCVLVGLGALQPKIACLASDCCVKSVSKKEEEKARGSAPLDQCSERRCLAITLAMVWASGAALCPLPGPR
jgi:hypothetical protein